jgi:hypothetical protein
MLGRVQPLTVVENKHFFGICPEKVTQATKRYYYETKIYLVLKKEARYKSC